MPAGRPMKLTRLPRSAPPRVIVQQSSSSTDEYDHFIGSRSFEHERYNYPFIQHGHGRLKRDDEIDSMDPLLSMNALYPSKDHTNASRTQFYMAHQLNEFRNVLNDLQQCLRATPTPETAWRSKILVRTAKELEHEIAMTIQDDYQAAVQIGDIDAQSTNVLFQREWSQLRKSLAKALASRDAESGIRIDRDDNRRRCQSAPNEDYFDRVSRQADLQQVQNKMEMVHDIYRDLAVLVDGQQEQVDKLVENVVDAKITAEAAADQVACYATRASFLESPCGGGITAMARHEITLEDDDEQIKNDVLEFLSSYFDCETVAAFCRPQQQTYEVEVVYEDGDDAIEIQHVDPPEEQHSAPPSTSGCTFLDGLAALQEDLVLIGRTVFEQECTGTKA